ncbi:MAG TPA: hypothetical protein VF660_09060 [Actinomycetota bacterium]
MALSVVFFGHHVLPDPGKAYLGEGADPGAIMWFLKWWPYALGHRLNPFVTHLVWAPSGANLAGTTAVPALALLAAPLTLSAGPIVAYNVLYVLAPALSGCSAFMLARHATRSGWAALAAGYLYGFSSYELSKMLGHLNLATVFVPPLAALLVVRRVEGGLRGWRFVLPMAGLLVVQFLISTEVFFTMTLFGGIALLLFALFDWRERRAVALSAGRSIVAAYLLAGAFLSPYLYYVVRGLSEPPIYDFYSTLYVTDPANFVVPTVLTRFGSGAFTHLSFRFTGNLSEQSAYLGLPMLIVVAWFGWRSRRSRTAKLLLGMFILLALCSLGPKLTLFGRPRWPLLWRPLVAVPLVKYALPARFPLYIALVVALMAAFWLADRGVPRWAKAVLMSLAVVSLMPAWSGLFWSTPLSSPSFFSSGAFRQYLHPGDTVVIVPYGDRGQSMLWQVQSDFAFRMAGGYVTVVPPKAFSAWPIVKTLYTGEVVPRADDELRAFVGAHNVSALIVAAETETVWDGLFRTIDPRPSSAGGVRVYRVPARVLERYRNASPP